MIKQIITLSRSGVEQAAADVATEYALRHSGLAREDTTADLELHIKQKVDRADGVLIIYRPQLPPDSDLAGKWARLRRKPLLEIEVPDASVAEASARIDAWVADHGIETVFITGPQKTEDAMIYFMAKILLQTALDNGEMRRYKRELEWPTQVDEAVKRVCQAMSLKDRTTIANMTEDELDALDASIGIYIRQHFGLAEGNTDLLDACRAAYNRLDINPELAVRAIIELLWRQLKDTHKLRIVK
jgi:hypothetical protein